MTSQSLVDVFPINSAALGLRPDWFMSFSPKLIYPSYLIMALFLVVSVGIMVLRKFEHVNLENKFFNIPVIVLLSGLWPFLVLGIKDLIDAFNTFLVVDVFQMQWKGFGFPNIGSIGGVFGWSAEALARLLPNFAYWVIYAFYIVFFFFLSVLGPLILAKGVLLDEIETFLALVREIVILFMWQTTVIILVAFILPEIVSGEPFPPHPQANFYFLCLLLGILMFFTPMMTRRFGNHFGSEFPSMGFRWGGAMLGIVAMSRLGTGALAMAGLKTREAPRKRFIDRLSAAEEFSTRIRHTRTIKDLKEKGRKLEKQVFEQEAELHHCLDQDSSRGETGLSPYVGSLSLTARNIARKRVFDAMDDEPGRRNRRASFLDLSRRAQRNLHSSGQERRDDFS